MFQKTTKRFQKLTLTQQALILLTSTLVFLLGFFFLFLGENIKESSAGEMYTMLEVAQQPIISLIRSDDDPELIYHYLENTNSGSIHTYVWTLEDGKIVLGGQSLQDPVIQALYEKALEMDNFPLTHIDQREVKIDNADYYYRMEILNHENMRMIVLSYMNSDYALALQNTILNSAIYLTFLAFFIVFCIFIAWVFSIIHPLNQIKTYISYIKKGKDVELAIAREDEIGEVARELVMLTSELARQEKAKEEMIHNISHDLKTPIATIKSYAESIKDGIYPYGDLESSLDVILDNSQRLEKKVHNLLYMNRVEYLLSTSEQAKTNMGEIVNEVVLNSAMIRPEIEIKTFVQDTEFSGPPEAWRVCLENILDNAFRYAMSMIIIRVKDDELTIYNDGMPIDPEQIPSLFRPYVKGRQGKFGLGLSIVGKIVKANGYKIEVQNVTGGVCFRIYNPVKKQVHRRNEHRKIHLSDNRKHKKSRS